MALSVHARVPVAALALAAACGACRSQVAETKDASPPAAASEADAGPRSPVLITIVVDQLAAWIASERIPKLADDGGFRRLLREGTYVRNLRFAHAATDTAPGHASLFTGAVPRESGIFANEVVDGEGNVVSILRDAATKVVFPHAVDPGASSSAQRLKVDTVADRLRAAHPEAAIVSLSLKDRGAIFGGGKRPTASVWLDVKQARFVTSSALSAALAPWAEKRGDQATVLRALGKPWELEWKGRVPTPDDQRGEADESGLGRTFPHRLAAVTAPGRVFRTLPASDQALLELGLDALAFERRRGRPTLLALSLSANDYVGHVFGPDSLEAWDELARLDRALAKFFDELDRRLGADGWAVMLTADHGTITMPEAARVPGVRHWCGKRAGVDPWERSCGASYRVDLEDLTAALKAAAERALPGKRDLVRGVADPFVFVGDGARGLGPADRAKLDAALRGALAKIKAVRQVFAVDALPAACPRIEDDEKIPEPQRIAALVCRSSAAQGEHAGAYHVVLHPGSFFDPRIVRGFGTSHGSPYLYDRTVPLFVRAPGRAKAGATIDEPVDFRAFAHTAAALLEIAPPPAAASGRKLVP